MEQMFMIEVFVKKIILKIEPYVKDEWELAQEAEEKRKEEERLAALAALEALKKPKKAKKPPKPKKEKKGKTPPAPSEQESRFMQTCSMQMTCLPLFDFQVAHDNFIAPPPPPPPPKNAKGKKPPKPKKKGKAKPIPFKRELPSEPLPNPPYFGVGNMCCFVSRPSKVREQFEQKPIYITVWNRDENFDCTGFCVVKWHASFFDTLTRSEAANPIDWKAAEYRNTCQPKMFTNTVAMIRKLHCEEGLTPCGEVEFCVRLTCMGNKVLTHIIGLPEIPEKRLPGRKYLVDEWKLKDLEVIRHWLGTYIENVPPVAYLFGAPDMYKAPEPEESQEEPRVYEEYTAPFTSSELVILAMGFPKGPCGGTNCPKRFDFRGSQHQFIQGDTVKGKYVHGSFVNKRDVHGPCGRLDCPLATKVRNYLCNEGAYKTCKKPCSKDYY